MNKNITILIFTDGRQEYFAMTFQSLKKNVTASHIISTIIIDDSNDPSYASWLDTNYSHEVDHIKHNEKRLGFGGTIRDTWHKLDKLAPRYDYVFHLEDDFVFNRSVNLDDLILILEKNPDMAQVCLLRQPWSHDEKIAGGVWQQFPDRFTEKFIDGPNEKIYYLSHKEWFSTNPCVYPKWVVALEWPEGYDSEERFWNEKLLLKGAVTCSYFGSKKDIQVVNHIGDGQIGIGY